jgi:hypothetical protein
VFEVERTSSTSAEALFASTGIIKAGMYVKARRTYFFETGGKDAERCFLERKCIIYRSCV